MKRIIEEILDNNSVNDGISLSKLKRQIGHKLEFTKEDLEIALKELELEGVIYRDKCGLYKSFPSNFFITEIYQTKSGKKYFKINDTNIFLDEQDERKVQAYDDVIIKITTTGYKLDKVLKRNFPHIICEVIIENNTKKLKPIGKKFVSIDIGSISMKKLVEGERVLIDITEEEYEDKYIGKLIKSIGHNTDPDIDFKTIAYNFGFDVEFPDEVINELDKIPDEIKEEDLKDRIDFRNWTTFTIDGKDCKDMDDAISIKKTSDGYLLGVHIAHVSHYIKKDSALFKEALKRSTSVYFPNYVIPMFPHKISNGICSLNEGVDRLTKSTIIHFDKDGNIKDFKIVKGVINSKLKMNYDDVNDILNGITILKYEPFKKDLLIMQELSNILNGAKIKRGYLALDTGEAKYEINEQNKAEKINLFKRLSSEDIIENFMLKANELNATYKEGIPFIYRNHETPDDKDIEFAIEQLKSLGYHFKNLQNLNTNGMLQKVLKDLKTKEEFFILSKIILQKLKRACYSTTNTGHYGLALDNYTHSTSPIRRIVDLLVQYVEDLYEDKELDDKKLKALFDFLTENAEYASKKERLADQAEYEADKLRNIEFAKNNIGMNLEVYIEDIKPTYMVVKSKELISCIIRYDDDLNDYVDYILDENLPKLKSRKTGIQYKIGHKLLVKIKQATYSDSAIYTELIENLTIKEVKENKARKLAK